MELSKSPLRKVANHYNKNVSNSNAQLMIVNVSYLLHEYITTIPYVALERPLFRKLGKCVNRHE